MASPAPSHPTEPELVPVDTALTVLSHINLLAESNSLALDIGGSLAKLIYLQPHTPHHTTPPPLKVHLVDGSVATGLSVRIPQLNGTMHFFAFETRNIHLLLRFIRSHWADHTGRQIRATGGGAYKYAANFRQEIALTLACRDEMTCTVAGLNFLLTKIPGEVYSFTPPEKRNVAVPPIAPSAARTFLDINSHPFPYLLVNIGSGVSIVEVTGHQQFERVSGSSLGGGTFWGLARILLGCETFDDVINLTHSGDNTNVDMLVRDIYGGAYKSRGLDANIIAASFGKATMRIDYARQQQQVSAISLMKESFSRAFFGSLHLWLAFFHSVPGLGSLLRALNIGDQYPCPSLLTHPASHFRPQDVALSLLRMVSYNIGQIAYLNARVYNLDRIYFGGNFIRNHPYTIADISFAVNFWSGGKVKALFLKHDGYLGAIGAFIGDSFAEQGRKSPEKDTRVSKKSNQAQPLPPKSSVSENETDVDDYNTAKTVDQPLSNGAPKRVPARKKKNFEANNPSNTGDGVGTDPIHNKELSNGHIITASTPKTSLEEEWTTVTRIRRRSRDITKAP